jgi:CDP-2,3-bis-(O-geranylgeranyl)-sn-glycerol synthase
LLEKLAQMLIFILPAYCANGAPVVGVKLIGRSTPLDRGARAWDGRRILGDGKTFEGLLIGVATGTVAGLIIHTLISGVYRSPLEPIILSMGAMVGDIFGSFIKRRLGLERGRPAPGLDQLGFLAFALLFSTLAFGPPRGLDALTLILLAMVTAILHLGTNYLAYLLRLKAEPW